MSTMGYVSTLAGVVEAASYSLDFEKEVYRVLEGGKLVTKQLSDLVACVRGTQAGRFNSKGAYELVDAHRPRIDYDPLTKVIKGILIEGLTTNLAPNSQLTSSASFGGGARAGLTGLTGAGMAYGGLMPAGAQSDTSWAYSQAFMATASTIYTLSLFLRYEDGSAPVFGNPASGNSTLNNFGIVVDGQSQLPSNFIITNCGDGLYRLSVTATSSATSAVRGWGLLKYPNQGAGTSALVVTGLQIEQSYVASSYVPSAISFVSRSSTGTYFDKDGVVRLAGINVPRAEAFEYFGTELRPIGLLTEPTATNRIKAPCDLRLSPWSRASGVSITNGAIAPDGSVANRVNLSGANSHNINQVLDSVLLVGTTYTLSIWMRAVRGTFAAQLAYYDNSVSLNSLGFTPTASWKRFVFTFTPTVAATSPQIRLIGFAVGADGDALDMWGCQLEVGAVATSFIPTTLTFTGRASPACFLDAKGAVQTAAAGVIRDTAYRWSADGKLALSGPLLESSSTNFVKFSNGFGAGWTDTSNAANKPVVTPNALLAPDGTTTATLIEFPAKDSGTTHTWNQQVGGLTAGSVLAPSVWLKADAPMGVQIRRGDGVAGYELMQVTTEWKRFESTPGANTGTTFNFGVALPANLATNPSRVYVWCAQLEAGPVATSEILTGATAVTRAGDVYAAYQATRAADVFSSAASTRAADYIYNTTLSNWFSQAAGTAIVSGQHREGSGTPNKHVINFQAAAVQDWMAIRNAVNLIQVGSGNTSTSATMIMPGFTLPDGAAFKAALRYKNNDGAFSTNGQPVQKDTTCLFPAVVPYSRFVLGSYNQGNENMNGWIKSFSYYRESISDAQLQLLTS